MDLTDTTEYLLSTKANKKELLEALVYKVTKTDIVIISCKFHYR